jgi:hypothetical protein
MLARENEVLAVGWKSFSGWLRRIGIQISADALETRRRRYGLPPRESVRGQAVRFTQGDVERWVIHLTGVELDLWTAQHRRARNARRVAVSPRRRGPRLASQGLWLPRHLFALTVRWSHGVEAVARGAGGRTYCALTAEGLESRMLGVDTESWGPLLPRLWRYDYARIATPADLHEPAYEHRRKKDREDRPANTMIVALARTGTAWAFLLAPGEWFRGKVGTKTRFILGTRHPGFADLCAKMRQVQPDTVFVAFTRRFELQPVTLDVMVHGVPTTGASVLREPPANATAGPPDVLPPPRLP